MEDKKMHLVHKTRIYSDLETKLKMAADDKRALKKNRKLVLGEWQKEPREF